MPVYEYQCAQCGFNFEKLVFHGDRPIRCPKCLGRVKKMMSPFSIEIPDELCRALPKGERRELCTECRQGGASCPGAMR
jgi:putative FmdB family regulatory protein